MSSLNNSLRNPILQLGLHSDYDLFFSLTKKMDLEVVGRHALLFDDDSMAAFVNSGDALVDWNSLQIDRYDVRHLLSGPLPPRRRGNPQSSSHLADSSLNSELDHERYLDLPLSSDEPEVEETENAGDGAYHSVAFSYGNTDNSVNQSNADVGSGYPKFQPPFPVPENLLHNLPPTEKVHQIIARTAMFVSKNGGQSEIILRVKQGDNPTFGFLMPDHNLHAYFRFLVDHQELLQSESDGKTQSVDNNANQKNLGAGGALSLLGSVYGSGEDEDSVMEDTQEIENVASGKTNAPSSTVSHVSEKIESSANAARKYEVTKHPLHSKEKPSAVKKNPSIAASKVGRTSSMKKEDVSGSCAVSLEKLEEPLIEPPPDLKILVDKIVDFILKNGNQFEAALREHDSKHGRFPFLVPSNQYHPYYLKVLQNSQESKVGGKNSFGKDPGLDKKAPSYKEEDGSISKFSDVPYESDRKEKFKMIIGKSKKDLPDQPLKVAQEPGISIDAEAAAAILQAATRGLTNPHAGITSCSSSIRSSQPHGIDIKQGSDVGQNSLVPNAKAIAKVAISESVSQHDSDPHLTQELKLKAERLKRAKMFVAMLKSGAVPSKDEALHAFSVEPLEKGVSISPAEVYHEIKVEGSKSDLVDINTLGNNDNGGEKIFREECNERRSRRKYRSRSERLEDSDQEEMEQNNSEDHEIQQDEEEKNYKYSRKKHHSVVEERNNKHSRKKHRSDEEERNHKHSRKKHRSLQDSDYDEEHKKEKSHRSSRKRHRSHHSQEGNNGEKNTDSSSHRHSRKKHSSHRHKREEEDKKVQKHSRKKRQSHRSSHRSKGSPRKYSSGDEGSQLTKYDNSSGNEDGHYDRGAEKKKGSVLERGELEEGEISPKLSDQSKSLGGHVSRETSADIASTNGRASSQPSEATLISDDLRAKIRAMLMTTM